jgi:hypothetical protein
MPDEDNIKWMPIKDRHQEEGAHELATSPNMEPYLNFAAALMQGHDPLTRTRSDSPSSP